MQSLLEAPPQATRQLVDHLVKLGGAIGPKPNDIAGDDWRLYNYTFRFEVLR